MIDSSNHPVLIHCRSGKHRTGALVGCLRMVRLPGATTFCYLSNFGYAHRCATLGRWANAYPVEPRNSTLCELGFCLQLQHWDLEAACSEYVDYCQHKQREVDKQYIERFDPRTLADVVPPPEHRPSWLPADCTAFSSRYEMSEGRPPGPVTMAVPSTPISNSNTVTPAETRSAAGTTAASVVNGAGAGTTCSPTATGADAVLPCVRRTPDSTRVQHGSVRSTILADSSGRTPFEPLPATEAR